MLKLKFSKISLLSMLIFTLHLAACAKEVPAPVAKEAVIEQITSNAQESSKQIVQLESSVAENIFSESTSSIAAVSTQAKINLPNIFQPVIKETIVEQTKERTVVASVESPKAPQTKAQTEAKKETAAQAMLNLDQYRGKVVYLDFWASWCVPCQQTFPWMDAMQKKYPDDIVFVAVNFGESPEDTQEFLKRFPADIKFIYDPLVQIASEYGVPGLPYSFIYGRKGELLGKHAGFSGGSEINLEAALKNLFESGE